MNRSPHIPPVSSYSPMANFGRWLTFWHIVYLGVLFTALGAGLWQNREAWGQNEWALVLMVAIQALLYIIVFIRPGFEGLPKAVLAIYFVVSIGLWIAEVQLHEAFWWVVGAYIGQIAGMLPPKVAIPTLIVLFLCASYANNLERGFLGLIIALGQNLPQLLLSIAGFLVLYLYIYHIARTSQERARLIAELEAAQAQLEHARQQEAELAVLQERERLARDLHDTLGHTLVALSVQLEAVQRLYRVDPEKASLMIDTLKQLTRDSTESLRRSLAGLRAPGLGNRPLRQALQTLSLETSRRIGVEVHCEISETADSLNPALAEAIWRVAQEALINIEKHAQAHQIQIYLTTQSDQALLQVRDDGVGLTAVIGQKPGHYGLRGMRERIEGLGGTLTLYTQNGTHLEAAFPLIGDLYNK